MRRVVMLLVTMTVALVGVAKVSLAKPHYGKKDKVTEEPLETTAGPHGGGCSHIGPNGAATVRERGDERAAQLAG